LNAIFLLFTHAKVAEFAKSIVFADQHIASGQISMNELQTVQFW
jgi:hypothetical protein